MKRPSTANNFISIPLTNHPITVDVLAAIKQYGNGAGIEFTKQDSMHITVCHLGNNEFDNEQIKTIKDIINNVCQSHPAFALATSGQIDFGKGNTFGKLIINSPEFDKLQADIVQALNSKGFTPNPLPCHISIARQAGKFGQQTPYTEPQMEYLQRVGNAIGTKSYPQPLIKNIVFFNGRHSLANFDLSQPNSKVLGISIFNVIRGQAGMIQFHFQSSTEANEFLTFAQDYFDDKKTIVARKDSPKIIRLSPDQASKLLQAFPEKFDKFKDSMTSTNQYK